MSLEHVLVAGGGSGGHVFPALAVADELESRGCRVSWLGRETGMERQLVEAHGLAYFGVGARALVGQSAAARGRALVQVCVSGIRARRLIRQQRIEAVLGTGGYVSAPGVLGAFLCRAPVVLLEPNAVPGAANRWLSRFATVAAIGGSSSSVALRCPVEETGVPIRGGFGADRLQLDYDGKLRILVLGGSQGARQLNELLPGALARLPSRASGIEVTHQVGHDWLQETEASYRAAALVSTEVNLVAFIEDVHTEMAKAHLIVSRAGAITLAEICAVGRAALLLPLGLAGSHQVANTRALVAAGGAVALEPEEQSTERLSKELSGLIEDRQRLRAMGDAAYSLRRPQAAEAVANMVERAVKAG